MARLQSDVPLAFRSNWRMVKVGPSTFIACRQGEAKLLEDRLLDAIVPLIDGTRSKAGLCAALKGVATVDAVLSALDTLAGLLVQSPGKSASPNQSESAEVISLDEASGRFLASTLSQLGVRIESGGTLRIVVALDYLDSALIDLNRQAIRSNRPWLLTRPGGASHWIGPLFVPGRTGCWNCLAQRLHMNLFTAHSASAHSSSVTEILTALAASRWLQKQQSFLEGTIAALNPRTIRSRLHRVARFPQCPECGRLPRYFPVGPVRSALSLRDHKSELTGIFSQMRRQPGFSGIYVYQALLSSILVREFDGRIRLASREPVCGKSRYPDLARITCMAEAIERYSIRFHGDERLITGAADNLQHCIPPDSLHFDTLSRPPDSRHWVGATSLISGETKLVPAGYCYLHFGDGWHHTTSNGCAAGTTLEEATLRGFLELVERDAVALWWYSRSKRPAVDSDALPRDLVDIFRNCGHNVFVLDLTTDFNIPAMAAIAVRPDGNDIVIGTAAASSVAKAVESAMLEAILLLPNSGINPDTPFLKWRRGSSLRISPWLKPAQSPSTARPVHAAIPEDVVSQLKFASAKAAQLGLDPLVVDMTRPEVGFPVARVVVPGLRSWKPHFAPGRLFSVPVSLGWRRKMGVRDLNPVPFFF